MVYIFSNIILNEKKYKLLIFKVTKSCVASKFTANLSGQEKKRYYKKALQTLYGQKDHLPWKTGQEK